MPSLGSGSGMWYIFSVSTITIRLPEEDFVFIRDFSAAQGISAEALFARLARNLREHLPRPLPPEVQEATGILPPELQGEEIYREHLVIKHA